MWIDVFCASLQVDALCINQSSKPDTLREQEHQVLMMVQAFGSARAVIGVLGERPKHFDEMLLLQCPRKSGRRSKGRKVVDELQFLRMTHPFWLTYQKFVFRLWFRRVWVSQEFALARELSLLIGHHAFDPDFLSTVMNRLVWQEPSKRHSVAYDVYLVNHFSLLRLRCFSYDM